MTPELLPCRCGNTNIIMERVSKNLQIEMERIRRLIPYRQNCQGTNLGDEVLVVPTRTSVIRHESYPVDCYMLICYPHLGGCGMCVAPYQENPEVLAEMWNSVVRS